MTSTVTAGKANIGVAGRGRFSQVASAIAGFRAPDAATGFEAMNRKGLLSQVQDRQKEERALANQQRPVVRAQQQQQQQQQPKADTSWIPAPGDTDYQKFGVGGMGRGPSTPSHGNPASTATAQAARDGAEQLQLFELAGDLGGASNTPINVKKPGKRS
jgi:hypothetical protein